MYGIVKRYFLNSMHFFEYIKNPLSLAFKGFQGFKSLNCMRCYELYFYCISASLFHQLPGIFFRFGTILKQKARCKSPRFLFLFRKIMMFIFRLRYSYILTSKIRASGQPFVFNATIFILSQSTPSKQALKRR